MAETLIGQYVSPDDAQAFVVYYHQLEQAAQTQSSPIATTAPSLNAAAYEWIQRRYPTEVVVHRAGQVLNTMQNLINNPPP